MTIVKINEAKTNLSRLIAEVEAGGEVVIQRGDVAVARLTAMKAKPRRVPGLLSHLGEVPDEVFAPLSDEDLELWIASPLDVSEPASVRASASTGPE
jgi:antitoxin (DNA-binding transcriptional repressor) of toxin-antitoxin stability system